jgi:hypothetical protein
MPGSTMCGVQGAHGIDALLVEARLPAGVDGNARVRSWTSERSDAPASM